ncbi:BREX-2 system adenine-specific DNA-methyltransferase PglX [Pseudomonas sp. WS 5013]|uniref:BREX-2 system adenine-specific DNA-methyltransferase PglX n=1 Tax=Pseudomonas sp. WS 5013 TaxID=2717475 RepID=UPI0014745578|nr:BREX-2 system adenine-specific DNA-methyltransferase PglX [Pseudomonas sp. WS 5013]NMY39725.1 BREX-2 system adenine-specific DNA-methyltransferase PglX [Pseudomonas sp. WS 5013]
MIDRQQLLKDLQRELPKIETDILQYSESHPELGDHLQTEYQKAFDAGRTSEHFVDWRAAQITQAAVAWVLTCVFVRFMEDNGLLDEPVLAGPVARKDGSHPLQDAKERITAYFNENPTHAEREYLLDLFEALERYPVIDKLLDQSHNPLWQIPVSADGAKRLVDFFQRIDPASGQLVHDFTDPAWDTRFLGDLYQDLSESVRKRYALLQTPEFVESFILDYTLEKAKDAFGLEGLRLIDPTCGSGHFLLTAFERMFDTWQRREPGTNARHLAQRALDVVHGVDINPYAVAIARFRLLIAAMKAAGSSKVKNAPGFDFHLAVGDSLLHGPRHEWQGQGLQLGLSDEDPIKHVLEVEDRTKLLNILGQRYHVVVGNPPYIIVRDKALNQAYRDKYPTCHRKYSLGVPFTERFFDLTLPVEGSRPAGYIGMITANSFMKREFGKKLIEHYLPRKDLTHVIDASGAYIPGHGTPTVILFARNREPLRDQLRAVLGIRGEPGTPDNAAEGRVWTAIVEFLEKPGMVNDFVTVLDQERAAYKTHPWSMGGGGATELKKLLEDGNPTLGGKVEVIGFGAILGEDDAFGVPVEKVRATQLPLPHRPLVEGGYVRDWALSRSTVVWFPYDEEMTLSVSEHAKKYLWPMRSLLWGRQTFTKKTYREEGRGYAEYHQIPVARNLDPLTITFGEVATHNNFVFDRGGKVFNRTAPVIKLPLGSVEDEYLELLGLLNSSLACFWMKQVFHNKGEGGGTRVDAGNSALGDEAWKNHFQLAGTGLKNLPLPSGKNELVAELVRHLDQLSDQQEYCSPGQVLARSLDEPRNLLSKACAQDFSIWQQMISLQEELDWLCYRLYGLTDEDLCFNAMPPEVNLGERPFEIALAQRMATGAAESTWFQRHGSTPITEIPAHWPADYRALVERRLQVIEDNPWIKLVEQPEYKRRWSREPWVERQASALKQWLLDRLETVLEAEGPALLSCALLADRVREDSQFQQLAELYTGNSLFDAQHLVSELVAADEVPQMASARLKSAAMIKFRAWQETWDKQRQEDAIDAEFGVLEALSGEDAKCADRVAGWNYRKEQAEERKAKQIGTIAAPPKYASTDFRKPNYWSLRGKLDVPKERFFSLLGCEKPGDATLVIGWAGLNHLQRAQAIAGWYMERKQNDGWEAEQLMPMLVALDELIPWLKQWHNELDAEYGERLGDYFEGFLFEELRELEIRREDLLNWLPKEATQRRGRRSKQAADLLG